MSSKIKKTLGIFGAICGSLVLSLPALAQLQENGQPLTQPLSDRYNRGGDSLVNPTNMNQGNTTNTNNSTQPLSDRYNNGNTNGNMNQGNMSQQSDTNNSNTNNSTQPLSDRYNANSNVSQGYVSEMFRPSYPPRYPLANRYNEEYDLNQERMMRMQMSNQGSSSNTSSMMNSGSSSTSTSTNSSTGLSSQQPNMNGDMSSSSSAATTTQTTQQQPVSAVISPMNGLVNMRLINNTGARVMYQVIGETQPRMLEGNTAANLADLKTPTTVTFQRQDGGLISVNTTPSATSGMLDVTLTEAGNLSMDKKSVNIQASGEVMVY